MYVYMYVASYIRVIYLRMYLYAFLSSVAGKGRNALRYCVYRAYCGNVFNGAPPFNTPASHEVSCNESTGAEPIVKISDHCPAQ